MLNLLELEQLVAFADYGTLSKAAETLNISQPTITRTMQHLEDTFGVPLFQRSKNHISLNETGKRAVEYARQLLKMEEDAVSNIRAFDKSLHTITISSCAPAPLWYLLPALSSAFPDITISSSIQNVASVLEDLKSDSCTLAVLNEEISSEEYCCIPFLKENLFVCVPPSHSLAGYSELTFSELNGHNFLLASKLGFWDDMCREKMPASRFLVQTDPFALEELIRESSLPCFSTNLSRDRHKLQKRRVEIPITDPDANITFHAIFQKKNKSYKSEEIRTVTERCRIQMPVLQNTKRNRRY